MKAASGGGYAMGIGSGDPGDGDYSHGALTLGEGVALYAGETPGQTSLVNPFNGYYERSCYMVAGEALAAAKSTSKDALDTLQGSKKQGDYDTADWTALTRAIANGKTAIDKATTVDAVKEARGKAIADANAVKKKNTFTANASLLTS